MTTIIAKTILRSRNLAKPDKVVSTLLLQYPRCIHAEFMTHRLFSRNAASSRAIPVERQIKAILDDPYIPLVWGANQKGMQSSEECRNLVNFYGISGIDFSENVSRENAWLKARDHAIEAAQAFHEAGYHKQIVNRLLEPFSHIIVVCSSTEWSNFLALRDHKDAEPHFQMLAKAIRHELDHASIQDLEPGLWHAPFINKHPEKVTSEDCVRSVACCASTSYKTVEGFDMTQEKAQVIFDKLVKSDLMHASPLEHLCQADELTNSPFTGEFDVQEKIWANPEQHGNFVGFRQYRKMLPGECQ